MFDFDDDMYIEDQASMLFNTLDKLRVQCDKTIAACIKVKDRLTHALIWNEIAKEEELTELAEGSKQADLMAHFYDDLASGCMSYY